MSGFTHEFDITNHAIQKYRSLTGAQYSDAKIGNRGARLIYKSKEVYIKPQYRLKQILNHGCELARYFQYETLSTRYLIVTDRHKKTVITIHNGEANRWT